MQKKKGGEKKKNHKELIASVNYDKVESIQKVERLPLEKGEHTITNCFE